MKFRKYTMQFTKTVDVSVYAPMDTTFDAVLSIGASQARTQWGVLDEVDWRVSEKGNVVVDVPEEDRRVEEFHTVHGLRFIDFRNEHSEFAQAFVVSDDQTEFVQALRSTWWIVR